MFGCHREHVGRNIIMPSKQINKMHGVPYAHQRMVELMLGLGRHGRASTKTLAKKKRKLEWVYLKGRLPEHGNISLPQLADQASCSNARHGQEHLLLIVDITNSRLKGLARLSTSSRMSLCLNALPS